MKERLLRLKLLGILIGLCLFWLAAWLLWSWLISLQHDTLAAWIILETALGIPLVSLVSYKWGQAIAEGFIEGQKAKVAMPSLKDNPFPNIDLSSPAGPAPQVVKQETKSGFTEL